MNRQEAEYLAVAAKDMSINAAEVAGFPLAHIRAGQPLSLTTGLNPAWAEAIALLQTQAVQPLLGDKPALSPVQSFGQRVLASDPDEVTFQPCAQTPDRRRRTASRGSRFRHHFFPAASQTSFSVWAREARRHPGLVFQSGDRHG